MHVITEHSIKIKVSLPEKDVHKKMEVFYNPVMKSNRNISVLLLNSVPNTKMNIADPLAGSGIRSLRFLKELKKDKINHLFVNDKKENFVEVFNENLALNKIKYQIRDKIKDQKADKMKGKKIIIYNDDAVLFLLNQIKHPITESFCGYFDYIDIDPFGTPNTFISAAVSRITRTGILAVTATDTAALTGTYPKVTKRKYWAVSLRNYMMHEIGLRILIRKVQLQGVQFDKALTPVLSYHKDHYFRIYFRSDKGKEKCDELIKQHQYLLFCPKCLNFTVSLYNYKNCNCGNISDFAGPLWVGNLSDHKLATKMAKNNHFPEEQKFIDLLKEESTRNIIGFYDLHAVAKKYKLEPLKMETMLTELEGTRTHFSPRGIKTEKKIEEIVKVMKNDAF